MATRKRYVGTIVGLVTTVGMALAGPPFTENWMAGSSPYFRFLADGGSTITSGLADSGASDFRVGQLTLPAFPGAGPGAGPNLQSNELFGFGTYEARLKTPSCASQPNTAMISGFFTFLNDGADQNGNGVRDNSEIDFEWLCAEPNVIWLTQWTDYQDAPVAMRRIYRELDLATGTIRQTCYSEGFGACTQNLSGSATEGSPSTITPLPGYNSATEYYTYGFTWLSNRLTWYVINPANGQRITLWDYRGPTARITQRPAWYMLNLWHTPAWTPPGRPGAVEPPNTPRSLRVDWVKYSPPSAGGTEIIIDNTSAGFSTGGSWVASTSVPGYYGANYLHDGGAGTDTGDWAKWKPTFPGSGSYRVEVRWTSNSNRADSVRYRISHQGGVTDIRRNQQVNGGTWVSLGTYVFAAGSSETNRVSLDAGSDSGVVVADAVRFVRE